MLEDPLGTKKPEPFRLGNKDTIEGKISGVERKEGFFTCYWDTTSIVLIVLDGFRL